MPGDKGKIKVKSPARQLADIAAEYFRPSGVPKSYANDAVEVHAVNLERRLTEAVDELITSRDFVIGELVKALKAIAIALKEPAGGEYWTARKFLDTQGVWHGDLDDERVLNAVAIAALKLAGRTP